jgi:8-amino-7-oxononanoate synthase
VVEAASSTIFMARSSYVSDPRDHLPGSFFGPSNLVDLLRHRSLHQANDCAYLYLVDGENDEFKLTYRELEQKAKAIAAKLLSLGMQGERAILLYPAGLDFIAAFFGCLYAGVIAVPAYPPRRNRSLARIQAIVDDSDAKVALSNSQVMGLVDHKKDESAGLHKMAWIATDSVPTTLASEWKPPEVHGDTLAFLQYTSGSTGTPKGVMLTHANLMHNSALISYAFEHTRSDTGCFWLPSYHDMGLIGGILQPMYIGQRNIILSPVSFLQKPFRWLQAVSKYKCTISGGPNFAYDLCVRKITPEQRDTLDLSRWHLAFNGAEPIRAQTMAEFSKYFAPCGFRPEAFYPCYGLAEATLIVSGGFKSQVPTVKTFDGKSLENHQVVDAVPDEEDAREIVGCGGNLLDQRIVIVLPESETLAAPDQVGEIWVSGPSVSQGYWNRPDASEQTFRAHLKDTGEGPFLRTGDLGFFKDSELFITGRLKDLIIIRGRNFYPQDIETTAGNSHPLLRMGYAAAFAFEKEGRERVGIVHELERGRHKDLTEVFDAIRREVAGEYELALDAITLIRAGSIPKTSSGKMQRHAAREAFLDGSLHIVARWTSWEKAAPMREAPLFVGSHGADSDLSTAAGEATLAAVYEHVRRVAKERAGNLTPSTSIIEIGLDSLERMEIASSLEETFGGRFPEDVLQSIETCGEVAAAVEEYLGKSPPPKDVGAREIPPEEYRIELFPEYQRLRQSITDLAASGFENPYFRVHDGTIRDTTLIDGRKLVSFASYNYIGLSGDATVCAAAKDAVDRYGTSVSASRLVSGQKTVHVQLEQEIAHFLGLDAAVVFSAGHMTNESTLGHLVKKGDLILHDSLAHNSIVQGAIMSGARRRPFPHNDWQALDTLLAEMRSAYRRVIVAIEGVYSMDGDFADLPKFLEVTKRHHAMLYVDEAHSLGIMGATGRGIAEHFGINPHSVDVWMGTLSKSLGSCGGYIAGSHALVEFLKYTAPAFVFSAGMSPANAAAALASVRKLAQEPERVTRLRERSELFLSLARKAGLDTGFSDGTPIVPVIVGNSQLALALSQTLYARGINVQPIMYPAVEERAARLRFFITSEHTPAQIRDTVAAVADSLAEVKATILSNGHGHATPSTAAKN